MGFYIETGTRKGKAAIICRVVDSARIVSELEATQFLTEGMGVVMVADKGAFEAAGFLYSPAEFQRALRSTTPATRKFIVMDRDEAERLSGYSQRMGTG